MKIDFIRDAEYFGDQHVRAFVKDGERCFIYTPYIPWDIVDRTDVWADDGGAIYER